MQESSHNTGLKEMQFLLFIKEYNKDKGSRLERKNINVGDDQSCCFTPESCPLYCSHDSINASYHS